MIERIKRSFCILLTLALAVTMLLPVNSVSSYAADDSSDDSYDTYEKFYDEYLSSEEAVYVIDVPASGSTDDAETQLANAMQKATVSTPVLINLTEDIEISSGSKSSAGLYITKGSNTSLTTVAINGNGYSIKAADAYTESTQGSALIYMNRYTQLVLNNVTLDGNQRGRCIYSSSGNATIRMYKGAVVTNGAAGYIAKSGNGIYLYYSKASTSYTNYLYMYEGSSITNCIGSTSWYNSATETTITNYASNGSAIYAGNAYLYLYGKISGCTVADTSTGQAEGTIYLTKSSYAYIYDGAEISNNSVISSANTEKQKDGGAFYIESGQVHMYGGTISNNTAQNGGAVYAYGGRFYLYGGTVSGNTAQEGNGGAVYTSSSGTVGVSADSADVQITGNTAVNGSGAGIYNRNACSVTATGDYAATVTGNYDVVTETDDSGTETETSRTAGDVYDWTTTTSMALAGNVSIGRIYVVEDQTLTLESALTGGSIGFYLQVDEDKGGHALEDGEQLVVVTAGDGYALTYSDLNHFSSENTAYRLAFGSDDNAGTIVVVNDDGGEYTDLSYAYVTAEDVAYTGSAQETNITVLCDGNYLIEGTDFNVIYQNNTEVGTATATIQAIVSSPYVGSTSVTFEITAKDIGDDDITVSDPGSYEILTDYAAAAAVTPTVEVTYGDLTLEEGTDYEVSYANNTAPGTATITLTGKGSYTGTRTVTFTITEKETEEDTSCFMVTDEETLNTALKGTYDVILFANDIEVENEVAVSRDVTIDGNGFTLSASQALSSESYNAILTVTSGTLALQNITVAGSGARDLYIASGAAVSLESTATLTGGGTGGSLTTSGTSVYNGGTLNLNGCTVKDSTKGSSIYNAEGAILNMYDGTLVTNLSSGSTLGMIVNAGTFNMKGGTILAGYEENLSGTILANTNYGRLVHNTGTFVMDGGTIDGLLADGETYLQGYTGMVHNYNTGTMTMNGGTIQHYSNVYPYIGSNNSANKGGTVMVSGSAAASFTMNGGTITENTGYVGAGVFVSYGSFTMNDGSITGNTSTGHPQDFGYMAQGAGAGVFVMAQATDESSVSASFTMNGGTISDNEAYLLGTRRVNYSAAGAGVFSYGADVALNGGTISGNSVIVNETAAEAYPASGRGAGVYLMSYGSNEGSLTLAGTEISGNGIYTVASGAEDTSEKTAAAAAGAGVYVYDTADADVHPSLYLGGNGAITVSDDVYLPTAYTYFTAKTALTGRSVAVSYSVPDTEAVGGRTVLAYADGLTGSDKDAACFTNYVYVENGTQYAAEYDSDANVVRIPTITVIGEPEVTITDYTSDDSYFYTGGEIIPEVEVKVTVAVTSGEEQVVTLTSDAYEVKCSSNVDVTGNAVMVIKSTGAYEFDDVTVNFKITKAESQTISFTNSDIEEASDGTLSLDTAYLMDVDFGAASDLGADVALSFTAGDDCVEPGDASETEYVVATLDDDGAATGSYTMNTVGTVTVTATVAETDNYAAATATLTLNIAKADQVIVETSDEISDPAMQSQTGYFRLTGTVYTWVDTTFTAYRSYTKTEKNYNSGGQPTPGYHDSTYTDTDHPTGATINLVTDDEDVAYAVADGESTERNDTGTWIYMAHIGTADFTVTADETDYYNAATLSSDQNWSGNQATLYVTVEGLEQNISGIDMTVGSGTAQALELQPNEVETTDKETGETTTEVSYYYYDASSDDVAVSFDDARSGLVFTPHSDVVSDEDVTIDYYNWSSSSVSQTGDGLTYAETVSLAISDDGKSIIVTPKAAGTVQFNVYLAASGDADQSSVARVRLTITKSEQTITTSPDDSTVVVDGTILTCMDDPDPIALHASTTAYGGVLNYKSSDTSVADVDSSGNVTVNGYGSAVITVSATGIKGYEDASLEVPIRTTQHTVVEDSVTFDWSDDYSSCVAYATCADCGAELELDCDVTSEWTAAETEAGDEGLTESGTMTYTAAVTFDGLTYTDVQTVETEICTHDYHATSYRWSLTDDGYNCTGIFACAACGDIQTAAAEAELTSDTATCSTDGAKTYTVELTVGSQTFTRTLTLYEEATGEHEYGDVTFDWSENEDGSYSCTATRTCIYAEADENCAADADSTQTVACTVTAETTAATCTEDGVVTYTAEAFFPDETAEDADAEESTDTTDTTDTAAGTTVTDTKTVAIAATGHSHIDASKYQYEWSGDAESGYSCTLYFVCTNCGERFPTEMNRYINCTVTGETTKAATCTEDGTMTYTASAVYAGETIVIPETQTAVIAATGHSYAAETDLGTGVTTYTCETCGDSYTAEETAEVLVYLEETMYIYDGTAIEPSVAVIVDGTALAEGTDYTVAYEANTDEGTATVTVTGTGSYTGTAAKTFLIQTEELTEENTSLSLDVTEVTYTGSAITPAVTVTDADGNVLTEGTHYEVVYSDNTEAGTATVTVVGIGNYSGSVTAAYTIAAAELDDETASLSLEAAEYTYTGSAITPAVTVTDADGNVLAEGTDYEVTCSNNTEAGTATVTVTGIGNYTGTMTANFTITEDSSSEVSDGTAADGSSSVSDSTGTTKSADTLVVRRGNTFYFSYSLKSGSADKVIAYGKASDEVYFGDWDGDGIDTPCVRRGNTYYFSNSLKSGNADKVVAYGKATDEVLVGDWDGDGKDTLAVRRGNTYYISNSIKSGNADKVVAYGKATDTVLAGDWNGDGKDTLAVRRGNAYYISNTIKSGNADKVVAYGKATDSVLVGDWDGDGMDTLTVRRGNTYYISNTIKSGQADQTIYYGKTTDEVYAGTWK